MKILIIDNYDSFTYNIAQAVLAAGYAPDVVRNDRIKPGSVAQYDKIIVSPGPGVPSEAGRVPEILKAYVATKSILGVCLGHQAIGECFGAMLRNMDEVKHGVPSTIRITATDYIFDGMPSEFQGGRYHSWVIDRKAFPECLEITAIDGEGEIMAIKHRQYDIHGVQFHPESILTPGGFKIIQNFINHKN